MIDRHARIARLVARIFGRAGGSTRARVVECLLRPLGVLGIAAVASSAFADLIPEDRRAGELRITAAQAAAFSPAQVNELARFAGQVDDQVWTDVAAVLVDPRPGARVGLSESALHIALRAGIDDRPRG